MKKLHIATLTGGILLAGLGTVMLATNPDSPAYEAFATRTLVAYSKEHLCPQVPVLFGLRAQCAGMLESNQAPIKKLIINGTQRQNFLFFSIYTTDLSVNAILPASLSAMVPSYHFETLGICQQFVVYQVQEQR